ncbi:MAG: hypothetical protein H7288_08485 [Kineosporiaceae bacterium]|nr:hypothetical protein [Aeromicrobium sp.]
MSSQPRDRAFPGALLAIAVMFAAFAVSTQTIWLRLISLASLVLVIAAAAYQLTRKNHCDE